MVNSVLRLAHKIEPRSTGVDRIKGKPPSCIRSHICLPIFKGRRAAGKDKTKKLVENVFTTYLEDRKEQRETTYIFRTLIRSLYEEQCPPALPPIQVTRNKQLHILTIFVSVSLDTGFLVSAVKHL